MEESTLRPSGGSFVSLMQFCSTEMGRPFSSAGGASADRNSLYKDGAITDIQILVCTRMVPLPIYK